MKIRKVLMFRNIFLAIVILFLVASFNTGAAQFEDSGVEKFQTMEFGLGDEVRFYGGTLDFIREKNLVIGRDAVDIEYKGMDLQADYVEYNIETGDVKARGNVAVEDGSGILFCEELELNLRTRTGIIRRGELFLEPTYYLTGVELRRLGFDKYKVIDGYYTACQAETPAWTIKTGEADAEVGGYLKAKDSSLLINNIPVFYSPYLLFPLMRDRSTGFLAPRVGYSQRKGLRWKQPFFWAMSDYSDLTLTPDFQGSKGLGIEGNFNYLTDKDSMGTANIYYISTKRKSGNNEGGDANRKDRWNIYLFQNNEMEDGMRFAAKLDVSSDSNFDRDFGEDTQQATKTSDVKLDSYVVLSKSWEKSFYKFNIGRSQDRIKSFPKKKRSGSDVKYSDVITDKTYQYLPQLQFVVLEQPVFGKDGIIRGLEKLDRYLPLKFRLDSSFASIRSKYKSKEYAKKGEETLVENFDEMRLDFHPEIIIPLNIKEILSVRAKVGVRETFYSNRSDDNRLIQPDQGDGTLKKVNLSGNSDSTREMYNIEISADGPKVLAVLNSNLGNFEKIKHVVQPSVKYVFVPEVSQKNIFQADEEDFISGREYLRWNLENSIFGSFELREGENVSREIMRLSMSQFYDFRKDDGRYRNLIGKKRFSNRVNNERALSDLRLSMELYPVSGVTVGFTGYVDPVDGDFDRVISHFRYVTDILSSKVSFSYISRWTAPSSNQALDWDEPDFNPIFINEKPYENIFSTVKLNIDFPGGWETGYTANFFSLQNIGDESINSSFFEQKQKNFSLRLKYIAQCWSVEGTYGVKEYFKEKGSLRSFDDTIKDDEFFWILVELKTLGEISSGGI